MKTENDKIDLRRYLTAVCQKYYYYVIAFVIFIALAIMYVSIKQNQYRFHSTILIEEEEDNTPKAMGGGVMQMMRTFSVGGFGSSSVDNEIVIMQSRELVKETVKKLKLNRTYILKEGLCKKTLYKESPIVLKAPDLIFDTIQTALKFEIEISEKEEVIVTVKEGLFSTVAKVKSSKFPIEVETKYGLFNILATTYLEPRRKYKLQVNISNSDAITEFLMSEIIVDYASKKADGISFEFKDVNKDRGCDILNTLMSLYNKKRLERKNEKARYEIDFLNERITSLGKELLDAEKQVEQFKLDNNLSNIGMEISTLISQDNGTRQAIVAQQSQIMIFNMMLSFLNNPQNKYSLLPMSEGLNDKAATEVLTKYNELLLERMKLERSAKSNNIAMQELNSQIDAMRKIVAINVQRLKDNVNIGLDNILTEQSKFTSRLSKLPKLEREYYSLMRDKELKNDLYIFLLEKKESSSLKLASNLSPGFIIDKAYADYKPLKTKKYIALLAAFLLTLITPTVLILFLLKKRNTINYVFDFPKSIDENNIFVLSNEKNIYMQDIRRLRSHLLDWNKCKVLFVTSSTEKEGRDIVIADTIKSMLSIGKKVLIIELDINNSSLGNILCMESNNNVTQFINGDNDAIPSISSNGINYISVDMLNACTDDIIMNDRFNQMIVKLAQEYDYIFINLPMVDEIADISAFIKKTGDLLYIVQAGKVKRDKLKKTINNIDKITFVLK